MKTFLQHATMFLILVPVLFIATDKEPLTPQTNCNKIIDNSVDTESIESLESSDWYSKVIQNIKKEEYNITYSGDAGGYQSPNRTQNLRFIYNTDGFTVKPRMLKIPLFDQSDQTLQEKDKQYRLVEDWQVTMKVTGYGKTNSLNSFNGKEINVSNNQAYIEDEGLKIEYENNEKGMRQNFIVKEKPEGTGLLKVKISTETELTLLTGAEAVVFTNKGSEEKLKYNSLKVWDAENKILTAHFEKEDREIREKNINQFAIVVNDENAVYPITIDPLSTTANWTAGSNQAYANFGYSVSTAGDVNGDGYSDVIVGAIDYDNGQTNEGRAFVYHGSAAGLSATSNWTAESNQVYANFGYSVSTAGDVNGDGYSDVIVGAIDYYNGQSTEGAAYVYHGSAAGLSATVNWTAESNQATALFGYSVSTAGDVNGDGYSDVIVGAVIYDNGETDEGMVFVWHGSSTGLGASGTPTNADWTAESNQAVSRFGWSVSTAGDVNGDGYSDVIVGAYIYDNGEIDEGRAFVYHGSATGLSATENWTAESDQASAFFGYSVSTAGDVNGDGYSDVIVGAILYDDGQANEGAAFVYHGSAAGLSATSNWTAESNQAGAYFGYSVSTAGDVNGDSFSDVIVGAIYYDGGQTDEGRAFVYHGASDGLSATANWTAESNQAGARFGSSVCTAGDVNGDGFGDVIVGASYYDRTLVDVGGAYVYHGSLTGLSSTANWTKIGSHAGDRYGVSVSTAGDVNGDGYSDVIVGADLYDNYQTNEGAAYVYYGTATGLSESVNWTAEGNVSEANYGCSVATAGDVNGDGFSDVIVGANEYGNGQSGEGAAFVYYGSMGGLATTANWTMESNQTSASFGNSVSTAGDVNGDGFSDIIVGAQGYDNGQTNEGRAFVYHGSATGLSATENWTAESDQASANFGYSVSTAGDVNGDGYSDVIVGAYFYDNGETNEGAAFVYHGSSTGLSAASNWTAESNQASALFGTSVSTAGDVNGDGYSDVIVGAVIYDNGETDEGRAFVYYGNNGGGLQCTPQQFRSATTIVVGPHGKTTNEGAVLFTGFAKSPYGRADGKLIYEYVENGSPFGTIVNFSGQQVSYFDLGTTISGRILYQNALFIPSMKNYRWRERTKYRLSNNPYQVFGPWRYYTSYQPTSFGSFKPQDAPLPVELFSFKASVEKGNVKLNWTTETEVNNYGFDIERKAEDEWQKLGFVNGNGNSNSPKEYLYVDMKPTGGNTFKYRLKQIDNDGSFEYSSIVEVQLTPSVFALHQNYPNPFNPSTKIKYSVSQSSNVIIKVLDILGNEIETIVNEKKPAGTYEITWYAEQLPSGVYFYQLKAGDYTSVKKMILMK